jgi:hypothetical protein
MGLYGPSTTPQYLQDIGFALLRPPQLPVLYKCSGGAHRLLDPRDTHSSSDSIRVLAWRDRKTKKYLVLNHPGQPLGLSLSTFLTAASLIELETNEQQYHTELRPSPYLLKFLLAVLSPYRCRSPWSALVQLPICWSHSGHLDGRLVEPTRGQCATKIQMLLRRNIRIQALKFYLEGYCYHHVSLGLHGDVNVSDVLGVAPCSTVAV